MLLPLCNFRTLYVTIVSNLSVSSEFFYTIVLTAQKTSNFEKAPSSQKSFALYPRIYLDEKKSYMAHLCAVAVIIFVGSKLIEGYLRNFLSFKAIFR